MQSFHFLSSLPSLNLLSSLNLSALFNAIKLCFCFFLLNYVLHRIAELISIQSAFFTQFYKVEGQPTKGTDKNEYSRNSTAKVESSTKNLHTTHESKSRTTIQCSEVYYQSLNGQTLELRATLISHPAHSGKLLTHTR